MRRKDGGGGEKEEEILLYFLKLNPSPHSARLLESSTPAITGTNAIPPYFKFWTFLSSKR